MCWLLTVYELGQLPLERQAANLALSLGGKRWVYGPCPELAKPYLTEASVVPSSGVPW